MKFSEELRNESRNTKQAIEAEKKDHVVERDFVEHLVELIKQECKKEAQKQNRHLECILSKDSDNDYYLDRVPSGISPGVHTLCYGSFGMHHIRSIDGAEKMHLNEDNQFIVNELRSELNTLGFTSVDVRFSYAPKREVSFHYKRTFLWGTKKVEDVSLQHNYYKRLYIKVVW